MSQEKCADVGGRSESTGVPSPGPAKTRLIRLGLVLFVVFFVFFIAEMTFRFYLFGFNALSIAKVNSVQPATTEKLIQDSENRELLFEWKQNLDTYFKLARFKTNSHGLRDKEYAVEKPAGVFRIAVVGDSYSVPSGVEIEKAYHTLLEDRLNAETSEIRYEVINFAVGGYSPRQYVVVTEHKVLAYRPDLILIAYCAI